MWIDKDDLPANQEPHEPHLREAIAAWRRWAQPFGWIHQIWNRSSARALLAEASEEMPVEFDRLVAWPERQKDLFMFFVLSYVGGVFADIDVLPLQPPELWFRSPRMSGARLVVGLEARGTEKEAKAWRWATATQLNVWTLAAAPGHPAMLRAVDRVLGMKLVGRSAEGDYLHSISRGPGMLTRVVDEWLQAAAGTRLSRLRSVRGRSVASAAADVVVYGIDGLGCGQPHSGSRPCNETRTALAQHLFSGKWKKEETQIDWRPSRRRRFSDGADFLDWRMPMLALHAHLRASGFNFPWEVMPLLFASLVPIEPPLLPAPPGNRNASAV